ncbi:uncharacterized protein H6S33_009081 [Morchella sextelata]|uniref:uncharacterized protein n=1 Tax=Morchella sextelata TaxID=1174677 RepID=UPI001D04A240|nr:uncharacterized protein H6S33_009081 [Morchella sextelata]KAH0612701.1 hypothetical protein H6S33_009081 [Morchella sextelata]
MISHNLRMKFAIYNLLTIRKYPSANTGINLYYHAIFGLSFSAFVSFTITACRGTSTVSIHWNFRTGQVGNYMGTVDGHLINKPPYRYSAKIIYIGKPPAIGSDIKSFYRQIARFSKRRPSELRERLSEQ